MLLRPVYTYRLRLRQIYIVSMEMDCLMGRMGSVHILSVKRSVAIGTMINFDGDGDGDGDGTCKQALSFIVDDDDDDDDDDVVVVITDCFINVLEREQGVSFKWNNLKARDMG